MKSFYDYCENVKRKTDLTDWMLQIKSNPNNSVTYLVLADFLQEKNGENKEIYINVAEFLRNAVSYNLLNQVKNKTPEQNVDILNSWKQAEKLQIEIMRQFQKLGYADENLQQITPNKQTQHQSGRTEFDYPTMSASINQVRDRPKMVSQGDHMGYPDDSPGVLLKRSQRNNVAIHDFSDEIAQLAFIFSIGRRILHDQLRLDKKNNCKQQANRVLWNGFQPGLINRNALIRRISNSHQCCDNYDPKLIQSDIQEINDEIEALTDDVHIGYQITRIILIEWVEALHALIEKGCEAYRPLAAKIVRDFRTEEKALKMLNK